MSPGNWLEWVAWAGIVIPLFSLAISAILYVRNQQRETAHKEYQRFFMVTDHLGQPGGSVASKMAAAYELRRFPSYSDVIVRLCEQVEVAGHSGKMLKDELEKTAEFFR